MSQEAGMLDNEHKDALRRVYQADEQLRRTGRSPDVFTLYHRAAGPEMLHKAWDSSWVTPSEHVIDDLAELGYLRLHSAEGKSRTFAISMRGREEARVLSERITFGGGTVPSAPDVLAWLLEVERESPETLHLASRVLDRAVSEGLVSGAAREDLAARIISLIDEGYIEANLPRWDQTTAVQELEGAGQLQLTMQAHSLKESGPMQNFYGPVINSQVAQGSITNYTTIIQLLDAAAREIDQLLDIEPETRDAAQSLLDQLRGKATSGSGQVATAAAGQLVATVLGQLIGLPAM